MLQIAKHISFWIKGSKVVVMACHHMLWYAVLAVIIHGMWSHPCFRSGAARHCTVSPSCRCCTGCQSCYLSPSLSLYIYIYTYVYTYIYIHTCIPIMHTYDAHVYTHTCISKYIYAWLVFVVCDTWYQVSRSKAREQGPGVAALRCSKHEGTRVASSPSLERPCRGYGSLLKDSILTVQFGDCLFPGSCGYITYVLYYSNT